MYFAQLAIHLPC